MLATENQLAEWKHAYRVLNLDDLASPETIKSAYRKLIKRWHPDRYRSGTDEHADATRMTELLNQAYAVAKDAPLHDFYAAEHIPYLSGSGSAPPWPRDTTTQPQPRRKMDWFGFWVRFLCGALFGVPLSFRAVVRYYQSPTFMIAAMVAIILVCALASGLAGDKFWHSIRPRRPF